MGHYFSATDPKLGSSICFPTLSNTVTRIEFY